jgi:hypothetical protein
VLVTPPGNPVQLRSILGRHGTNASTVGQDVVIDHDGTNVGAGQGIYVVPTAPNEGPAQYKSIAPTTTNPGIAITSTATEVQLQAMIASAANLGSGGYVLANPNPTGAGTVLNFRSVVGTNGITHTQNANDVTLSLNATNVGGAVESLITPISGAAQFRTMVEGGGINITQQASTIKVDFEGASVGTGTPIYVPAVGTGPAQFKSLMAGAGIAITSTATDITVAATVSNAINVGTGIDVLVTPVSGGILNFRRVLGRYGTNALLVGSDVVVDYDAENVGTGEGLLVAPTATDVRAQYKSLKPTATNPGLVVTSTATEVQLQAVVAGAINVGATAIAPATATAQVLANGPITAAGTVAQFKSLTSSDNSITITQTATQVDLKAASKLNGFHTTAATFNNPGSVSPNVQSITHNLGTNQIMVQVRDSSGEVLSNYKVTPGAAGSNTVGISWGAPSAVPVGACTVAVFGILP